MNIPLRSEIAEGDTWDLSKLFPNDEEWNKSLAEFEKMMEKIHSFKGTLGKSAVHLADYLDFSSGLNLLGERLGNYAFLRQSEDEGASTARTMFGKITMASAKANAAAAWENPEILAIPQKDMETFLSHERIANYRIYLQKILRYNPHILNDNEERIIALHAEGEGAVKDAFSVLTNVDFNFGMIDTQEGKRPLSQSTFSVFMESGDRDLRQCAYKTFYNCFVCIETAVKSLIRSPAKIAVAAFHEYRKGRLRKRAFAFGGVNHAEVEIYVCEYGKSVAYRPFAFSVKGDYALFLVA